MKSQYQALVDALKHFQHEMASRDPFTVFFAMTPMIHIIAKAVQETEQGLPDSTTIGQVMDALAKLRQESPIRLWMLLSSILIAELETITTETPTKGDPHAN